MKKVRKLIGKIKAGNNIALAMDKKMREIKTKVFTFYKDLKYKEKRRRGITTISVVCAQHCI